MGRGHLNTFAGYERSRAVAICELDADRLAEQAKLHDIPEAGQFTDYKKMLSAAQELGLEAVSVALPNKLHAPVTTDCLKAGLHVLCEKPMAMTAAEARKMLAASEQTGKTLMINFSFRFNPQSQVLKRIVDEGTLGEIYYGRTRWLRRRGMPKFGGWFGQKDLSGGGPIIDLGVHRLDLAMWLMGNPRPVTVSASTFAGIGPRVATEQGKSFDVEDLGCALIRFDNGATVLLEASWAGFFEKQEDMLTQLLGTKGGIIQRNVGERYDFEARLLTEQGGGLLNAQLLQPTGTVHNAYEEFVNAVLDERPPVATGRHGLDVQLILDAIYQSARDGKEIRIKT
jgi:predicted dehydrogenase